MEKGNKKVITEVITEDNILHDMSEVAHKWRELCVVMDKFFEDLHTLRLKKNDEK